MTAIMPEKIKSRVKKACASIKSDNPNDLPEWEIEELLDGSIKEWARYYMDGAICFDEKGSYTPNEIIKLIQHDIDMSGIPNSPQKTAATIAKFLRQQGGKEQGDKTDIFTPPAMATMIRKAEQNRITNSQKLSFGIEALDEACGGVYGGNMLGIFGNPGSHKTMLLTNAIAQWIKEGGSNVWLYELDMGASVIYDRLLARELRCTPKMLRSKTGTEEYEMAKKRILSIYSGKLWVMDRCNNIGKRWTVQDIIEGIERYSPEIVAIDYLTCLEIKGRDRLTEHELAKTASKMLTDAAQRYGTLIITLSQMSQASQQIQKSGGFGAMPMGGTDVWNDSDVMIELQNDTSIDETGMPVSNIIATVRKSRTDGKINSSFKLNRDFGRFTNNAETAVIKKTSSRDSLFSVGTRY